MEIQFQDLASHGYEELERLHHQELVPFIRKYLKKRTAYAVFYYVINAALFALSGYLLMRGYQSPDYRFENRFAYFANGIALTFALIPLHEYIHALAYQSQGAKNTSYDANLKKFYFMAIADKFVANRKEFTIVALAPFVFITISLVILYLLVSKWQLTLAGILLTHTAMCSGDFGLLSFFAFHKDKAVVTYDDKENGLSFFYGKAK